MEKANMIWRDSQGNSLMEILVTLTLTSLLIFIVTNLVLASSKWINESRDNSIATWNAVSILASLSAHSDRLSDLNSGKTAAELDLPGVATDPKMQNLISSIHQRDDFPDLYDVSVTVYWGNNGTEHRIQLSAILRKE